MDACVRQQRSRQGDATTGKAERRPRQGKEQPRHWRGEDWTQQAQQVQAQKAQTTQTTQTHALGSMGAIPKTGGNDTKTIHGEGWAGVPPPIPCASRKLSCGHQDGARAGNAADTAAAAEEEEEEEEDEEEDEEVVFFFKVLLDILLPPAINRQRF